MKKLIANLLILFFIFLAGQSLSQDPRFGKIDDLPKGAKLLDTSYVYPLIVKDNKLFAIIREANNFHIIIYSSSGKKLQSIYADKQKPYDEYISKGRPKLFVDNNNNIWIKSGNGLIIFNKDGVVINVVSSSFYDQVLGLMQGKENEILFSTLSGQYKTSDLGSTWELYDGTFPDIHDYWTLTFNGQSFDTIMYKLSNAQINPVHMDHHGRFWGGSSLGLIYSDDNLNTWHVYDKVKIVETSKYLTLIDIVGINSKDDMLLDIVDHALWIKKHDEDRFRMMYQYKSEFEYDGNPQRMKYICLCNNLVAFLDARICEWYADPAPNEEWVESYIKLSKDFGKTWKKFRLGHLIGVTDMALTSSSVYLTTSKGFIRIPFKYFH